MIESCSSGRGSSAGVFSNGVSVGGVPLPDFWFPPGWKLEYEWPDDDPAEDQGAPSNAGGSASEESTDERKQRIDNRCGCGGD